MLSHTAPNIARGGAGAFPCPSRGFRGLKGSTRDGPAANSPEPRSKPSPGKVALGRCIKGSLCCPRAGGARGEAWRGPSAESCSGRAGTSLAEGRNHRTFAAPSLPGCTCQRPAITNATVQCKALPCAPVSVAEELGTLRSCRAPVLRCQVNCPSAMARPWPLLWLGF